MSFFGENKKYAFLAQIFIRAFPFLALKSNKVMVDTDKQTRKDICRGRLVPKIQEYQCVPVDGVWVVDGHVGEGGQWARELGLPGIQVEGRLSVT